MSVESITRQLEIVKGLMGYRYGDADVDSRVTRALATQLTAWGISDIRDFGRVNDTLDIDCTEYGGHTGRLNGFHYINKRTGASLTPVSWIGFTGTGIYEGMGYGSSGGFYCGGANDLTYEWDSRFDNYIGDAGEIGDNRIQIFVQFTQDGVPYFIARLFNTRGMSFWQAVKELATIALAAISFVVPGVNAAVAGQIFGSLAVSYPALTAAASQVMLNTALSGGDVEAAVKSVAYSYLGNAAGGIVQGVSDSEALGRLAAAATTAAAQGGDVQRAVEMAALRLVPSVASDAVEFFQSGSDADQSANVALPATDQSVTFDSNPGDSSMSIFDIPSTPPSQDWDELYAASVASPSIEEMASWAPAIVDFNVALDSDSVPLTAPTFEEFGFSLDDLFASVTGETPHATPVSATGEGGALPAVIAQTPANEAVDTPASAFFDDITWDGTVDKLTSLAIAAIRVHQAYQAANRPPVQPAVQTTRGGGVQTVRTDGTLTTTDPTTGRVVVTRPPAGVPYELPGGAGAVINNGNGTYTVVSPDGQTATRSYAGDVPLSGIARVQPESWVPGVPNWAILAGAAGIFAVIVRK